MSSDLDAGMRLSHRLLTKDGRCLMLMRNATVASAPGAKITISEDCDSSAWMAVPGSVAGEFTIQHAASGLCATIDSNLEFVTARPCNASASVWLFDAHQGQLSSKAGEAKQWGQGNCLTAVEPNPRQVAALALRVAGKDGALQKLAWTCGAEDRMPHAKAYQHNGSQICTASLPLPDGADFTLTTAIITQVKW